MSELYLGRVKSATADALRHEAAARGARKAAMKAAQVETAGPNPGIDRAQEIVVHDKADEARAAANEAAASMKIAFALADKAVNQFMAVPSVEHRQDACQSARIATDAVYAAERAHAYADLAAQEIRVPLSEILPETP